MITPIPPDLAAYVEPIDIEKEAAPSLPYKVKRALLIALSILMALGLVLSALFDAPWCVPLFFFACALAPLFPLGRTLNKEIEVSPVSNRLAVN